MPKKAKKSSTKEKDKKEEVHVALYEPDSVRVPILEAAKKSVTVLQRESKLEEMRRIKVELFKELKAVLTDIMSLNARLEKLLPKVKREDMPTKRDALTYSEDSDAGRSQKSRFGELEMELADIEKRISRLH